MQPIRFTEQFKTLLGVARQMTESAEAEAILLLLEGPAEWSRLKSLAGKAKVVVAGERGRGTRRGQGGRPGDRPPRHARQPRLRTPHPVGARGRGRRHPHGRLERGGPL